MDTKKELDFYQSDKRINQSNDVYETLKEHFNNTRICNGTDRKIL